MTKKVASEKLKFNKQFIIRVDGVEYVFEAGKTYKIEGEASITRWIKRGCEKSKAKVSEPIEIEKGTKFEPVADIDSSDDADVDIDASDDAGDSDLGADADKDDNGSNK